MNNLIFGGLVALVSSCVKINQLREIQESWETIYEENIAGEGTYSILKTEEGRCFFNYDADLGNDVLQYDLDRAREIWDRTEVKKACD